MPIIIFFADPVPAEFDFIQDMNIPGGNPVAVLPFNDCLSRCLMMTVENCAAVDYDEVNRVCYLHTPTTACNNPTLSSARTMHAKRKGSCANNLHPEVPRMFDNQFVPGGLAFQTNNIITEELCIEICQRLGATICIAVDYDKMNNICYSHQTMATACQPLQARNNFKHIRIVACPN